MNEFRPEVAVIIPARNAARSLGRQLESLVRQTAPPRFEVVVADNGSTDETIAIARSFVDRLDLRVVDAAGRRGPSYARNRGASAARAPVLLFCDADDVVGTNWVRSLHEAALATGAATGPIVYVDSAPQADDEAAPSELVPRGPRRYLDQVEFAGSGNLGMERRVFEELGGFDLDLRCCEDADLTIRAQCRGSSLSWATEALVVTVRRPSLLAAAKQFFRYGYYDARVFRKLRGRGLVQRPLGQMLRPYVVLALTPHRLLSPRRRWSWVINVAQRGGRLVGSIRFRVVCL